MNDEAIVVRNVCKSFRIVTIPRQISLKEMVVRRRLFERRDRDTLRVDAVKNATFSVARGQMLGIIGRNGSGKTTMLRLLGGIYRPDSGSLHVAGDVAPLLSLGLGFHPDMSGRENVKMNGLFLGLSPKQIERRLDGIVDFAELREYIDVPVRMYSTGMYMRLAFSVALSIDPDVLLLDEVMAVGDAAFVEKCLERMRSLRRRGKTIVLVTHDTGTVAEWCDHALWMEAGVVRAAGSPLDIVRAYEASVTPAATAQLIAALD